MRSRVGVAAVAFRQGAKKETGWRGDQPQAEDQPLPEGRSALTRDPVIPKGAS